MRTVSDSLPGIDLAKALASQVILWHHFALYGPMSATVAPLAADFWDWVAGPLRWAVQVFLVTGVTWPPAACCRPLAPDHATDCP